MTTVKLEQNWPEALGGLSDQPVRTCGYAEKGMGPDSMCTSSGEAHVTLGEGISQGKSISQDAGLNPWQGPGDNATMLLKQLFQ